jgi:23S rRNA-/tRNA-specific pseudouridylate synthase
VGDPLYGPGAQTLRESAPPMREGAQAGVGQVLGHPLPQVPLQPSPQAPAPAPERMLLHATRLALTHPLTGETMVWESAPPWEDVR